MSEAVRVALAVVVLIAAAALATVAILALAGRLPRNRWAGVRTPATMASPEAFQLGNRVAAVPLLAGALPLVLAAVAVLLWHGALGTTVALVGAGGTTVMVVAGGLLGNRAAAACNPTRCATCTGCDLIGARD